MKNIVKILFSFAAVFAFVLLANNVQYVSAQSWEDASFVDYNNSVTSQDPTNSIVSNGCMGTGCDTSFGWYDATVGDYNDSITSSNPTNSVVSTGCFGDCGFGSTYTSTEIPYSGSTFTSTEYPSAEIYTPSMEYTPSMVYTSPTISTSPSWTGYDASNYGYIGTSYIQPSYSTVNYTTASYANSPVIYTNTNNTVVNTQVTCPAGSTRNGNTCVINQTSCPTGTALVNGTCQTTQVTCPSGTTRVGNTCQINTTSCPSGTTLVNGSCQVTQVTCPSGTYLVNGTCQVTTTTCPSGSYLVNGTCQITQTQCPAGTYYSNGSCIHQVVTQSCWDGSVIPTTSVCPTQYKVCNNGSTILVTQSCPVIVAPTPVVPPPVVKFNNVVTSVATEITSTQGRCRGIGLIANNAQSTGWFEYGETANLGRTTSQANIGSANTAPFSNLLTNLKPNTTYYCRAVMQNQYGLVKGEVVSFKTKAKTVAVVKPVAKPVTKKVVKTNEVICSDGSIATLSSQSAATLLNSGKKLITLEMEKTYGAFSPENIVTYKVAYKNISDTKLSNVSLQITIPDGVQFASSTVGMFDPSTRILSLDKGIVAPYENGIFTFTVFVPKDTQVGRTIAVTGYMSYAIPGTSLTDEVTTYVVSTVVPQIASSVSNGDDHSTSTRSFLPNSLIEWLALIAILFIIFILGRSIYISYNQKDTAAPAHH